eukprot:6200406-Pleurochrysis_carterae.AAC.1
MSGLLRSKGARWFGRLSARKVRSWVAKSLRGDASRLSVCEGRAHLFVLGLGDALGVLARNVALGRCCGSGGVGGGLLRLRVRKEGGNGKIRARRRTANEARMGTALRTQRGKDVT